jgi:hypothetical protein
MLALLVAAAKFWLLKQAHLLTQLSYLASLPALFVPDASALVMLKTIFAN